MSVLRPALALSPLQTPSADLFHYDSMNAVNWGMRGECQPPLGLNSGFGCTARDCVTALDLPQTGFWPYAGLCPNPEFPHSLSLPIPSLFPSSSLILSSPWPWVISRPSVPSGFPEPLQSRIAEPELPASPGWRETLRAKCTLFPANVP